MNFCWCTITVKCLEDSVKFYQQILGLKVSRRFSPSAGMEIVFLDDDKGNKIELIDNKNSAAPTQGSGISIGFEVTSMEDALAQVRAKGIAVVQGPFTAAAVKFFYVKDPSGVTIQIVKKTGDES